LSKKTQKPLIRIREVLKPSDTGIATKQHEFSNKKWLIKSDFMPIKLKKIFHTQFHIRYGLDNTSLIWEQALKNPQSISGKEKLNEGLNIYTIKAADGTKIGVDRFFYDYFKKYIPNFSLKASRVSPEVSALIIYSGDVAAGMIMPIRL